MPQLAPKQIAQAGATANQALVWNASTGLWTPTTNIVAAFLFGANTLASSTTTRYLWPGYQDSQALTTPVQFRMPFACTLTQFRVRHNTAAGNGNNVVYTVRQNGTATALVVTMASTASDGSDLTDSAAFAAGDLVDIQVTKASGIGTSPSYIIASLEAHA